MTDRPDDIDDDEAPEHEGVEEDSVRGHEDAPAAGVLDDDLDDPPEPSEPG